LLFVTVPWKADIAGVLTWRNAKEKLSVIVGHLYQVTAGTITANGYANGWFVAFRITHLSLNLLRQCRGRSKGQNNDEKKKAN
jgi:hypothetical protein